MSTMRLKVGLVTVLSCLALLLGLLGSTGIASAHTAQAAQSSSSAQVAQSQISSQSHVQQYCHLVRVRVYRFIWIFGHPVRIFSHYAYIIECHPGFWYDDSYYSGWGI
jgi:hypothetical protein